MANDKLERGAALLLNERSDRPRRTNSVFDRVREQHQDQLSIFDSDRAGGNGQVAVPLHA